MKVPFPDADMITKNPSLVLFMKESNLDPPTICLSAVLLLYNQAISYSWKNQGNDGFFLVCWNKVILNHMLQVVNDMVTKWRVSLLVWVFYPGTTVFIDL